MVKNLISAALALFVVAGFCFLEAHTQKKAFGEMHRALIYIYDKAEEGLANEEDGKALQALWKRKKEKLHVFIPHTDIREMDLWLSEAVFYLSEGDYAEACGKIKVLIHFCENLPDTYDFSLENFL